MDVLGTLKKNLLGTKKFAAEKAKIAKEMFKLNDQIRSNKKEIRTLTYKIGQTYIDLHSEDCEEAFADYVRDVLEAKEELAEKEKEFAKLKEQAKSFGAADDDELAEFFEDDPDEVPAEIEEVKEAVEEAAEEAAVPAAEAVEDADEAFEDAVEDIED